MKIHTNEFDFAPLRRSQGASAVVECADLVSQVTSLARIFTSEATDVIMRQFALHRTLAESGVADAGDLICRNGQLLGYTIPKLPGVPLSRALEEIDDQAILCTIRDIAFATFSMHAIGFIHSDISPGNIWVNSDRSGTQAQLLDLGFATAIGERVPTEVKGTEDFMAPDSAHGSPAHPAWDAYSFGKVVERTIPRATSADVVDWLAKLASECTRQNPAERLHDFAKIYIRATRFLRSTSECESPHSRYLAPLRATGMTGRMRHLHRLLDGAPGGCIVACSGVPQIGKSELLRSTCAAYQSEGIRTIRYTDVVTPRELLNSLETLISNTQWAKSAVIFIETNCQFVAHQREFDSLAQIANACQARIVLEIHSDLTAGRHSHVISLPVRSLSIRESINATSHLVAGAGIIGPHADALWSVTTGRPGLMRKVMTDYVKSGRRERREPLDFARWTGLIAQAGGVATGNQNPSAPTLPKLQDLRSRIRSTIAEVNAAKMRGGVEPLCKYKSISRLYGELGSPRRQSRWARRGIDTCTARELLWSDPVTLEEFLGLMLECVPPRQRIDQLCLWDSAGKDNSRLIRIIIKSELGAAHLYLKNPAKACESLLEALPLAKREPGQALHLARILNRLGTAKMINGEYPPARQYLAEAAKVASSLEDKSIMERIKGNLGLISLYTGEPADGCAMFKALRWDSSSSRNYAAYLSHLLNETVCLQELGRGMAAERRARLAVSLGEMLSDSMLLAYSYNNLGWVLMTQCQAADSASLLRKSLVVREAIGDYRGTGDCYSNLARLNIMARNYDDAGGFIDKAERCYHAATHPEGVWDCFRIRAKSALLQEDHAAVHARIAAIPMDSQEISEKDRADILLMNAESALWMNDSEGARAALARAESRPIVTRVIPLAARHLLLKGHLALISGDIDMALKLCNDSAEQFRKCNREDLLLEALTVLALLAFRMGNSSVGLRNLQYVKDRTAAMREELR